MPTVKKPAKDTKLVRLELNHEEHVRLRIEAARHGLSMAAFARQVILEKLKKSAG